MCERCDIAERAVDEASAREGTPLICSAPECGLDPVVRFSVTADHLQILCQIHMFVFGIMAGVKRRDDAEGRGPFSDDELSSLAAAEASRWGDRLESL